MANNEAMIEGIISEARGHATESYNRALGLITAAVSIMNHPPFTFTPKDLPKVNAAGFGLGSWKDITGQDGYPHLESIAKIKMPEKPEYEGMPEVPPMEIEGPPTIDTSGLFNHAEPAAMRRWNKQPPKITAPELPNPPTLVEYEFPDLIPIDTDITVPEITIPDLSLPPSPRMPALPTGTFAGEYTKYSSGTAAMMNQYLEAMLAKFCPGYKARYAALGTRVDSILQGRDTALTDVYDDRLYSLAAVRIKAEHQRGLDAVADLSRGQGWEMPGAVQFAASMRVEQQAIEQRSTAALEVYKNRTERELQHLQFVMTMAQSLYKSVIDAWLQYNTVLLDVCKTAESLANSALKIGFEAYRLAIEDFDRWFKQIEAQIRIWEAKFKKAMAALDLVRAQIEIEKLKEDLNQDILKELELKEAREERKIHLYARQLEAAKLEADVRKLPLDIYIAELEAYSKEAIGVETATRVFEALMRGDESILKGRMAPLEVYKAQLEGKKIKSEVQTKNAQFRIEWNRNLKDQYLADIEAEIKNQEGLVAGENLTIRIFEALLQRYKAETEKAIATRGQDLNKAVEDAKLAYQVNALKKELVMKEAELELNRIKSIAEVNQGGASVAGSLAQSSLSALNALVSTDVIQYG